MVVVLQSASTHTVVQRGTLGYVPFIGDRGIVNSVERTAVGSLRLRTGGDRDDQGASDRRRRRRHCSTRSSHDFGNCAATNIPRTDNAQSWFRHIIAELGLLGSIPVLWWCVVFGDDAVLATGPAAIACRSGCCAACLIGFFVASLFGMPAQSIAIVITFWVFVFWFLLETRRRRLPRYRSNGGGRKRRR